MGEGSMLSHLPSHHHKKIMSKDYSEIYDKSKAYPITEAIELARKMSKTKFVSSLEVHFRLGIDPRKGDQQIRSAVSLPHGTGKTVRVAAFVNADNEKTCKEAGADLAGSDELIDEIKKTEKTEFDVAVAEPDIMKKLGPIAKILGTRGLMPSPKNETVTANPAKAVAELKKGKVSFRNDENANLHVGIGKLNFTNDQLVENYNSLLDAIKKIKPAKSKGVFIKNISICSTMGPGIKVAIS